MNIKHQYERYFKMKKCVFYINTDVQMERHMKMANDEDVY